MYLFEKQNLRRKICYSAFHRVEKFQKPNKYNSKMVKIVPNILCESSTEKATWKGKLNDKLWRCVSIE